MARRRQRFIDRRKTVGLSQEQLAEATGVDRTTVTRWERAQSSPQPGQRPRLATALDVSAEQLHELLLDIVDLADHDVGEGLAAGLVPAPPVFSAGSIDASTSGLLPGRRSTSSDEQPWFWSHRGTPATAFEWPVWFGMRLAHLVGAVDAWLGPNAQSEDLQTLLHHEILMYDTVVEPDQREPVHALSRRQALVTLAALPLTIAAGGTGDLDTGTATQVFLSRCAASLTACWHLLKGSDLAAVDQVLSTYRLKLEAIAHQSSKYQEAAARLASQAHRICGIVALHRDQLGLREHHCKQALYYATVAADLSGCVSALISLASTHFYASDPARAADVCEQALAMGPGIPPLQQSRIHAELAVVYGQLGRERQTLESADLAVQLYPAQPEQDPSFLYAEFTPASLTLERGLSYLTLAETFPGGGYARMAVEVFAGMEQATTTAVPDRIRFEIVNHRARAAVLCDDLDAFEAYASEGAEGVMLLGSRQRQKELRAAWRSAAERWPHERRLKALGERLRPVALADTQPLT